MKIDLRDRLNLEYDPCEFSHFATLSFKFKIWPESEPNLTEQSQSR